MAFTDIPYVGSFQRGKFIRSSNPLKAAWREIEKLGTVDRLAFIAKSSDQTENLARPASLKIHQAIELWKASQEASILTRPLLIYYSMLNLTRGMMLPRFGTFGELGHGLSFNSSSQLLQCKAKVGKRGTFLRFAESLDVPRDDLQGRSYTLRDLLAVIPEMLIDFPLLKSGESSIVSVHVYAIINGPLRLVYHLPNMDENTFASRWESMFPWWKDQCVYDSANTLRFKENPKDEQKICELCRKHLIHDMRSRQDAIWYDQRVGNDIVLLPRQLAYLAAMFILSNVVRYEPEFLDSPTSALNDLGFFLESFLDNAERFYPQLTVELLYNMPVFFE